MFDKLVFVCRSSLMSLNNKGVALAKPLLFLRCYSHTRQADFVQPSQSIASPFEICVVRNNFFTFHLVDDANVGKAAQMVEYHLNGDRMAHCLFTAAELRELLITLKNISEQNSVIGSESVKVNETVIKISMGYSSGMTCLHIEHLTPFYSAPPFVIPFPNLKEFIEETLSNVVKQLDPPTAE